MNNDQLEGTLYIGFPNELSINKAIALHDEISDYIDNNHISLEVLQADEDYNFLSFKTIEPSSEDKLNYYFWELEIETSKNSQSEINNSNTNFINICVSDYEDVCELLSRNGYNYNNVNDFWLKSIN